MNKNEKKKRKKILFKKIVVWMSWRRLKCFDRHERDRSNVIFDGFLPFISLSMPFNQSNTKPLVFFAQFARCIYDWNENGEVNGANAIVIE